MHNVGPLIISFVFPVKNFLAPDCWALIFLLIDYSLFFIGCCILSFYSLIYSNFIHLLMVMIYVTQDETGVYKNLLQEVAQRVGAPLPLYTTERSGLGHLPVFTCTVELAGITFAGDPAKNKKQAEKNAASAAWSALKQCEYHFLCSVHCISMKKKL
jgi:hypothetical protein